MRLFLFPAPLYSPHLLIPQVLVDSNPAELYDDFIQIPGSAAVETAQSLASNEGIFTGISGGGTMWAAIETAKKVKKRRNYIPHLSVTLLTYTSQSPIGS